MPVRPKDIRIPSRSRGAALIVALLLLLVMTILGVTAMSSSTMQGFMSSSYQQQTSALAGVENVLLEGEFEVETLVADGVGSPPPSYYLNLLDENTDEFEATSGAEEDWLIGSPVSQTIGEFDIPGRYMIEYLGEFEVPGESIAEGGALEDSRIHVFRVSARGAEAQRGGLRIVQSLYVTLRGPDED
jgi:type IV pilus assembly protein PilX